MITVTRIYTRPNIEVPWHLDQPFEAQIYPQSFKDHVQATYGSMIVHLSNTLSDDKLSLLFQSIWNDEAGYQTYLADPVCTAVWAARDAHNAEYGITSTPSEITQS